MSRRMPSSHNRWAWGRRAVSGIRRKRLTANRTNVAWVRHKAWAVRAKASFSLAEKEMINRTDGSRTGLGPRGPSFLIFGILTRHTSWVIGRNSGWMAAGGVGRGAAFTSFLITLFIP